MHREIASNLYKLKCGETTAVSAITVLRVPGGWIFTNSVWASFVPFNNEFDLEYYP